MNHHLENGTIKTWGVLLVRAVGKLTRSRLNSVWVLSFLLLLLPDIGSAGTNYFYTPQSVGNISGRAYADGDAPVHWLNMSTFGQTSSAVSQTISGWNEGDFTGVASPTPVGNYQRGISNSSYGSSAVQMTDTTVGAQVNTFTIPGGSGYNHNLANAQVQYKWNASDNIKPWAHTTSNFNFSYYLQVPKSYFTGGAVGYVYASFLVTDGNNHNLWIQPQTYDVRGVNSSGIHESIGFDAGTDTVFANTKYGSGTRYCTQSSGSNSSTGSTWSGWRWYGESINRSQLLNAINDANSKYGAGLSTDTASYALLFISIQDEIAWPSGNGWLPFSAEQIWAYETY
jgi:hypothetical protein